MTPKELCETLRAAREGLELVLAEELAAPEGERSPRYYEAWARYHRERETARRAFEASHGSAPPAGTPARVELDRDLYEELERLRRARRERSVSSLVRSVLLDALTEAP